MQRSEEQPELPTECKRFLAHDVQQRIPDFPAGMDPSKWWVFKAVVPKDRRQGNQRQGNRTDARETSVRGSMNKLAETCSKAALSRW